MSDKSLDRPLDRMKGLLTGRPNRQQRRHNRREVRDISDRAIKLRAALLVSDQIIEDAQDRKAKLTADVHGMFEDYINSIAKVVDLDTEAAKFASDDDPIYAKMVQWGWRGVETVKQACDLMTEEVAIRSVGKTDLSLLLTSIDHTALRLYVETELPDNLKELHGEALVEAGTAQLKMVEFDGALMKDPRWAAMRERWVRLGWRGTDVETFNDAFQRAVMERVAVLHDGGDSLHRGFLFRDTVNDDQLHKARPEEREQMIHGFSARLEHEFNLLHRRPRVDVMDGVTITEITKDELLSRGATGAFDGKSEVELTLDSDDVKRLDVVANRWGTTRNGAMERIVHEAVLNQVKQAGSPEEKLNEWTRALTGAMPGTKVPHFTSTDAERARLLNSVGIVPTVGVTDSGPLVISSQPQDATEYVTEGDWWNDSIPYSDHELMRRGRMLWEGSYAQGMTDEEVRRDVVRSDAGFPAELVHFSAKWAVHAFQRLMTSHTFASALMCSDVQRDVLMGIEKQWDAFLVLVPNGMLVADRFEFTRVAVATYSFGVRMMLITADPLSVHRRSPVGLVEEAPTLPDLLVSDEADLVAESQAARCFVLARRLVAGLLLNLQHEPNFKVKTVEAKPKKKGREAEPEHRIVTVGKPLEIDCRDSVKEYVEHGKAGRKHGPPTVQVMVRGHYRRQVCGVGRMDRKVIWIEPFWRGPEAALIQTRPTKAKETG